MESMQYDRESKKLLDVNSVVRLVTQAPSTIYRKVNKDEFPKPRFKRYSYTRWRSDDIERYLQYLESEYADMKWSEYQLMITDHNRWLRFKDMKKKNPFLTINLFDEEAETDE